MKDYMKIYEQWLADPYFDEDTKNELRAIAGDENEIRERFYMDLEFGTAGLRGIIGAGINRMNIYTVRRATQGLANYIKKQGGEEKGVAIAFDSRRMSPEFAMEAAMTLAANGIKAYKFESLRPTPELSFAVRELAASPASISQPATIRRNTTAIRYTGRTAPSSPLPMIRACWRRYWPSRIFPQ